MERKGENSDKKSLIPNSRIKKSYHMPQELLTEILARLPSKSLIRFRCVSKSWDSLITGSTFITTHLNFSRANNPLLFLYRYHTKSDTQLLHFPSLYYDTEKSLNLYLELEFPFRIEESCDDYEFIEMVGTSNGLLCVFYEESFILFNPLIKKVMRLPSPFLFNCMTGVEIEFVGFCFHSRDNDYKVVRVSKFESDGTRVEVYSLNAGSWRIISGPRHEAYEAFEPFDTAFVNGVFHWLANYSRESRIRPLKKGNFVLCFDLSDELCKKIALPRRLARLEDEVMSISVFENKYLAVFQHHNMRLHLWVMKEYGVVESWAKLFTIDHKEPPPRGASLYFLTNLIGRPFAFRKNGEVLIEKKINTPCCHHEKCFHPSHELISCDPQSQESSFGILGEGDSFYGDSYVESLVLLNESRCSNFLEGRRRPCDG